MEPLTQISQEQKQEQKEAASKSSSGLINPSKIYQLQGSGNLIDRVVIADISARQNGWKLVVVDTLVVISAGFFGYSFARYLAGGFSAWFLLASFCFWSALSMLEGFLQKDIPRRFLVIVLESLALIAFFYSYAWQASAAAAVIVILCLMWGYFSVRRELRSTVEIRFFAVSGKAVGKVATAGVLFMIVMYASLMNSSGNFFVSQDGFNVIFNWSAAFANNFYPNIPLNDSFGSFAQAVAQAQLQNDPAFKSLPPAEQAVALTQSTDQIMAAFTNESSTATSSMSSVSSESTNDVFYNYLSAFTVKLQDKFGNAFVGVWGLILFFILRSIGIIVVWAAQFVCLIFYEILLATGFMKIAEQSATKEILEY